MRVTTYKTLLDENLFPVMVKEGAVNYGQVNFSIPCEIVRMMNDIFRMDVQSEEYMYELCFTTKMKLIGIFEIAHGTVNLAPVNPREIFQKALICGAMEVVFLHNHPSGDPTPSRDDITVTRRICDAGRIMGIHITDHIIVGREDYCSLRASCKEEAGI